MAGFDQPHTFVSHTVNRVGYGAIQLAGPGVFGPPKDRDAARAVLREAVASGVNHIDTSDFYGPHITNKLIREALHPYRDDLLIVTKIGARRGQDGSWLPAMSPAELSQAVHDNLHNLGLDVLDVVNLRSLFGRSEPAEGSIEAPLTVLAELQRKGLVRHIGLLWRIGPTMTLSTIFTATASPTCRSFRSADICARTAPQSSSACQTTLFTSWTL
jgi:pyridoxine 4-dehydrogenase